MADMSLAADRPLNWNLLGSLSSVEIYEQQLAASDLAARQGAHVVALTLPDLMRMRSSNQLASLSGWGEVLGLDGPGRRAAAADAETRARLRRGQRQPPSNPLGSSAISRSWKWGTRSRRGRGGRWARSLVLGAPTPSTCSSMWCWSMDSRSTWFYLHSPLPWGAATRDGRPGWRCGRTRGSCWADRTPGPTSI